MAILIYALWYLGMPLRVVVLVVMARRRMVRRYWPFGLFWAVSLVQTAALLSKTDPGIWLRGRTPMFVATAGLTIHAYWRMSKYFHGMGHWRWWRLSVFVVMSSAVFVLAAEWWVPSSAAAVYVAIRFVTFYAGVAGLTLALALGMFQRLPSVPMGPDVILHAKICIWFLISQGLGYGIVMENFGYWTNAIGQIVHLGGQVAACLAWARYMQPPEEAVRSG